MLRQPRILPSNAICHIVTRGNNQNNVFRSQEDYCYYLNLLRRFKKEHTFELFHYCLMPNHVHLLVQIYKNTQLPILMKKINLGYFHYFKRKYGWVGHFWQNKYKSQLVNKDSYLIQCGKYIELNPVRAGLVKSPQKYRWSSYRYYVLGESSDLISENVFYLQLGKTTEERQRQYQELVISELIKKNRNSEGWGGNQFKYNISRRRRRYHNKRQPRVSG